jgi:carotenoid cleavage dioxygenase
MAAMTPGHPKLGFNRIAKHDGRTGEVAEHAFGPGRLVSEFTFVPAGSGEDHGYLMGFVFDAATDRSDLVLLDAQNPSTAPIARVRLPQRVPQGFHGGFIPANAVGMA